MSEAHDALRCLARHLSNQVWISAAEFGEAPAHARCTRRGAPPRVLQCAVRAPPSGEVDGPRMRLATTEHRRDVVWNPARRVLVADARQ